MQLWLARPISQAVLAAKQFRSLDAHKGEDLAFEPLRHILAGKDMLLYHASQFSRGEEKMSSFFSYVGSLRIAWAIGLSLVVYQLIYPASIPSLSFFPTIMSAASYFSPIGGIFGAIFGITFEGTMTGYLFQTSQLPKRNILLKKLLFGY